MNWLTEKILKNKVAIILTFTLLLIFSVISAPKVSINYDMVDYLPEGSHSTTSIDVMNTEFDKGPPNVRIMLEDTTKVLALRYKEKLSKVEGVKEINWLDDSVNVEQPLEMIDEEVLNSWYKDNKPLFTLVIDEGNGMQETIKELKEIVGDKGVVAGSAVVSAFAMSSTDEEVKKIIMFLIPTIIVILMISTSSWFEPVLFLFTVGISILINMGTNIFLGEISFITNATGAILQLAVSMDYAIFLLH